MIFICRILRRRSASISHCSLDVAPNSLRFPLLRNQSLGWFRDPLRSNQRETQFPDTSTYTLGNSADPEKKIIQTIIRTRNRRDGDEQGDSCYQLGEDYLDRISTLRIAHPTDSEKIHAKVTEILEARFNYNPVSEAVRRSPRSLFYSSSRSDSCETSNDFINETFNPSNLNCGDSDKDLFSHFESEFPDYYAIRRASAFYEKSNAVLLTVSGLNADYLLNQILSTSATHTPADEVQYACMLDSKGVILDTCFVAKQDGRYILVTTGNRRNDLLDYISSYVVHLRGFGLDVSISPLDNYKVIDLYGPLSLTVLTDLLNTSNCLTIQVTGNEPDTGKMESFRLLMKRFYLKFKDYKENIICYRVSDVEDGFEFLIPKGCHEEFSKVLLSHNDVRTAGPEAYDVARLESGVIRPDLDLTPESTPMHASLMWNVDIKKIRRKLVFGHKNFGHNMVEGVSKIRVGLISNKELTRSCTILTESTRMPIGSVTSSAFSPALGMYIAHCYVNRNYAKHDMPVVISIPQKPGERVTKAMYKRLYRNATLKDFFRGTIVRLPFINPSYQVKTLQKLRTDRENRERQDTERLQVTAPMIAPKSEDRVKSRKEIWKEIIKKQKRKLNGTLAMACTKWEKRNQETVMEPGPELGREAEEGEINRINTIPNKEMAVENILNYYRSLNEMEVGNRHRRYRPSRHTLDVEV